MYFLVGCTALPVIFPALWPGILELYLAGFIALGVFCATEFDLQLLDKTSTHTGDNPLSTSTMQVRMSDQYVGQVCPVHYYTVNLLLLCTYRSLYDLLQRT